MKRQIEITQYIFVDETTGNVYWKVKEAKRALRKGHEVRAIITTKEGKRRLGTSSIVNIKRKVIETENSFYVFA